MSFQLFVKNLSKSYGTKTVLSSVSCTYQSGLIHGIVGANGSGKTTFFNCLTHNLSFQGKVEYPQNGRLGYLPTELFMYSRITGMEFIHFCLNAKDIPVEKNKIESYNTLFELPLNEYAETYSTGMLKKLYLFVLILEKNEILILDEPFNGLDVNAVSYISELLLRLKTDGTMILISSHIIDHLCSFCDTLTLIENGQILLAPDREGFVQIEKRIKEGVQQKFKALEEL